MTPPWSVYLPSNTMMEFQIFGSLLFRALGFFPPEPTKLQKIFDIIFMCPLLAYFPLLFSESQES